jgi:tryptophan 2-monooxygenase
MQFNTNSSAVFSASTENPWIPHFPNPADFRFNYFKLLSNAPKGIGKVKKNVAIVGAGCAGMTTARELMRCGCNVTIFEASDRIGGRLYTRHNPNGSQQTGMEMGAMRMPFFNDADDDSPSAIENSNNCILAYYLFNEANQHNAKADFATFPNPGNAPGDTGIYINQGMGPDPQQPFASPRLIEWKKGEQANNETIQALNDKVDQFVTFFTEQLGKVYVQNNDTWEKLWQQIVNHYTNMTFDDVVIAPAKYDDPFADLSKGDFGGMGMNDDEASILYTVGTGDGSWGAFYSISALWWIRCTMFGFGGKGLQTIIGLTNPSSLPHYNQQHLTDASGNPLSPPLYQGIQSLVEYLYFVDVECQSGQTQSLFDNASLHLNTSVSDVTKKQDGSFSLTTKDAMNNEVIHEFDNVVVTSAQWASQMSINFEGMDYAELPAQKTTAEHTQHNISSCKLFFPLNTQYWKLEDQKIPQILVTDSFIQDAYAFSWSAEDDDKGVILASYTWEDDSLKLLPFDEQTLSKKVLDELAHITISTTGEDVTQYIDMTKPVSIQWITQPTYIGCAKLYRQRDEALNKLDLAYNQNYAGLSGLYFAGENYGVEGGWTEPALRSAIDAVIQFIAHEGDSEFTVTDFNFQQNYPRWSDN